VVIFRSYKKLKEALLNNTTNCVKVTTYFLNEIRRKQKLNAFVEVFESESLLRAAEIDKRIQAGKQGRLAGMVIGIKDNISYKNHRITASSKILQGFESLYNSTVVERLLEEDAIIIGRLNCDEFAMGSSNENTIHGPVRNPINIKKVAGGSSGGSAAAVAGGLCLAALGSDTGGSIRQPAAFCGVIGMKPTYSRVSRYGLIAYASSFDQIGPITNNIYDSALLLEVMAGSDKFDNTSSNKKIEKYTKLKKIKEPKKIGYIKECFETEEIEKDVKKTIQNKIESLKLDGHIVEPVSFPLLDFLVPTYYVLTTAEASSNLARYDGVHYGYRDKKASNLLETYYKSRSEGFGPEVKRRIMLGTFVLSSEYYDDYYTKAQKIRRLIYEDTKKLFENFEFIISPTTPHTAFDIGMKHKDPTRLYLEDIFTVQANLSGNPAISLPVGKDSNGLPVGLHIMSDHFNEKGLFSFSQDISKED
jgi:aspartyl-tRNA(Asn)/glutamyl-tRNA(Gln) amidotransferase subunit A